LSPISYFCLPNGISEVQMIINKRIFNAGDIIEITFLVDSTSCSLDLHSITTRLERRSILKDYE